METQNLTLTAALDDYISDATPERIRDRYHALAECAKTSDFGVLDEDVVVLDTETTGVSFKHDELTQIAAARMKNGEITEWYVTFVNPGKHISSEIAHLTGITDEIVADAPSPEDAIAGLAAFVGSSDIVAHNAAFDRNFTTKGIFGAKLDANTWIDSLDLARIALPRLKSHRLIDLVRAFGGPQSTHRADDDVAATCVVYRVLLAAVCAMPPELVAAIADLTDEEQWPTAKVFKALAPTTPGTPHLNLRSLRAHLNKQVSGTKKVDAEDVVAGKIVAAAADDASEPVTASLRYPDIDEISRAFTADGLVGSLYEDYEPREEQREMAQAVTRAIASSRNLVVEAGTGVGKSMAYLVPLVRFAKENNCTVGVATKSNALLDQLVNKEIPLLDKALDGVNCVPLKGFSHYPCLRRIARLHESGALQVPVMGTPVSQAPSIAGLLSFVEQSDYDDMDALKIDYRTVPRYAITTSSADCLRRKCPFFGKTCFVHGAREAAQQADVVVTNHSLLFCDLKTDGGLLPPVRQWVIDEAHSAENEARRALSLKVSMDEALRLANRVSSGGRGNIFTRAERAFASTEESETLFFGLLGKARAAGNVYGEVIESFCRSAKALLYFNPADKNKGYEFYDLWINDEVRASSHFADVAMQARALLDAIEKLIKAAQELVGFMEDIDGVAKEQREIAVVAMDLKEMLQAIELIFVAAPENYVYSVRLNSKKDRYRESFEAQLLDIGPELNETLYANTHSIVFASATLSIAGSFDTVKQSLGLDTSEFSQTDYAEIPSSYDYDTHMKVYVASDMPEPNNPAYLPRLQSFLGELHKAREGSLLTLFTNRREMDKCYAAVADDLKLLDLRVVCQKWGVSVKGLRDDFLKDEHLSLFALKSFWEGFDAPGATLKGVVIPKLPFGKPTDPLSCERSLNDSRAWMHYVLPAAVLDVKQAAGRLIRRSSDTGILVLADARLVSKGYGKTFLSSLPSQNIQILPMAEIVAAVEEERKSGF